MQRVVVHTPPRVIERAKFQAPVLETPRIKTPILEVAKIEAPEIEAPGVAVAAVILPKPDLPAPVASLPAPPGPAVTRSVKVGGFGDPNEVHASETSTGKGLVVARVGSFDLPAGSDEGRGGGGNSRVAMAGFGDGGGTGAGVSSGHQSGQVQSAGFGDYRLPPRQPVQRLSPRRSRRRWRFSRSPGRFTLPKRANATWRARSSSTSFSAHPDRWRCCA